MKLALTALNLRSCMEVTRQSLAKAPKQERLTEDVKTSQPSFSVLMGLTHCFLNAGVDLRTNRRFGKPFAVNNPCSNLRFFSSRRKLLTVWGLLSLLTIMKLHWEMKLVELSWDMR